MFCPNYGNEVREGVTFCFNCGQKIEKNSNFLAMIKNGKISFTRMIICVATLLLVIIIYNLANSISVNNNAVVNGWSKDGNKYYVDGKMILDK